MDQQQILSNMYSDLKSKYVKLEGKYKNSQKELNSALKKIEIYKEADPAKILETGNYVKIGKYERMVESRQLFIDKFWKERQKVEELEKEVTNLKAKLRPLWKRILNIK